MGLFSGCGPVILKENSDASEFIQKMEKLLADASDEIKKDIEKQIKLASYGEIGEKNIIYELKNSGLDMFILHDIYLEIDDLSAQIDFLIIAKKCSYVIECKNLIGNIDIDNKGGFIRTYELRGRKVKEGIYSPVTQNERHLNVIKKIRLETKNILTKSIFEKNFDNVYKSIVCLANPKTILNDRYASKEIKGKVIRADQLVSYIKNIEKNSQNASKSEKDMRELAEFFLSVSKSNKSDYSKKYEEIVNSIKQKQCKKEQNKSEHIERIEEIKNTSEEVVVADEEKICPKCGRKMVLRTSSKGEHAGNKFYGCSGFPKCRHIENV